MFTDTHCHLNLLNLEKYDNDIAGAITAMKEAKVSRAMAIMCDFVEYDEIYAIINEHTSPELDLGMSVGIHPCEDLTVLQSATVERLLKMAQPDHVWALGETGLDYYWSTDNTDAQKQSLVNHIQASKTLKKPLIIHTREAKSDTLEILQAEKAEHGIIHCFTEDWATAKQALDLGFYISLSGIVTFKKSTELQEVALKVPKDRLLIETDSPYLAPTPKRGRPNEPAYVAHVAEFLAGLLNVSVEQLGQQTSDNFSNLRNQYN